MVPAVAAKPLLLMSLNSMLGLIMLSNNLRFIIVVYSRPLILFLIIVLSIFSPIYVICVYWYYVKGMGIEVV